MEQVLSYFSENRDHLLFIIAGLSFLIELSVMGLSSPLFFFAVGTFLTAIMVSFGLVNEWEMILFTVGACTAIAAAVLWGPLKRFQNHGGGPDTSSDMIGRTVPVSETITATNGKIRFSGIDWNARLDNKSTAPIAAGEHCVISGVEGNIMIVKTL